MTIAILSALPEEQQGLSEILQDTHVVQRGGRRFIHGQLYGHDIVFALSGIGKVAAATTTTLLIEHFGVQRIVFTGVAGGIGHGVEVGDIVVAQHFLQHDMDVRPLFQQWLVPGYQNPQFSCDANLAAGLHVAALHCVQQAASWQEPLLGGRAPQVHAGLIISGDQFIVSADTCHQLRSQLHTANYRPLAVEMEGAAIAQVCADYGVAFAAVRTVSDRADNQAHVDFPAFVSAVASRYAHTMIQHWLQRSTQSQPTVAL